jgi:AraC family transcriptional regulator of adaptative response/methylated-DNA-[protein]-cysteine methyltransferase
VLRLDPDGTRPVVDHIFSGAATSRTPLHVLLRGTNFQIKVWEALLRIAPGEVTSYSSLAALLGNSKMTRAVGNAVAHNPVAYLIPCHRVIRTLGGFGRYRYGPARKKAMLLYEMAGAGGK